MIGTNWHSSYNLDLEGCLALEWKLFRRALINSGVQLLEKLDELIWMGEDVLGQLSVKNVYVAMEKKEMELCDWRLEESDVVLGMPIKY